MKLTKEDVKRAKGRGFLQNRGTEFFSGRVVSPGGVYTSRQLACIAQCAEKYASGTVSFTSRLSAEIPGLPYDALDEASAFIAEENLFFGGTGPKIRPITACKGTVCVYGNIDTQGLARLLHERFYLGMANVRLPHKFKIAVGGCPNSCMKPSLNDVGVEGHRRVSLDSEACKGCKTCAVSAACPSKAVTRENGKMRIDGDICQSCGVCVGKCPFGAVPKTAEAVCKLYVGGTWGRSQSAGKALKEMVDIANVPDLIEKTVLWYRENGFVGERFAITLKRHGMDAFESAIATDSLLSRRDEILSMPLKTKDGAS